MSSGEGEEKLYLLRLSDYYLLKQYFSRDYIFNRLSEYYNQSESRFEIPESEITELIEFFEDTEYEPVIVDDVSEFVVVKRKYTEHSRILENAVFRTSRGNYNVFVMKDRKSVENALAIGAESLEAVDIEFTG